MPTTGFEVRGRIVRQRSPRFASVHFEVDCLGQQFAVVRQRAPEFAGVAVTVAVKNESMSKPAAVNQLIAKTAKQGTGGSHTP
jgi:hypothetical protein